MPKDGHPSRPARRIGLTVAIASLVVASSAATATAASITVSPSSGLNRSGQSVTVNGTGFGPADSIDIYQCRDQENWRGCYRAGGTNSAGGSFSAVVQLFYRAPQFDSCEDEYCKVYATGYDFDTDEFRVSNFFPISFAGSTSTTSTPSPGASFGAVPVGQAVTDTAVVTGNAVGGSPTGQMSFWICGPDGYVVCAEGGTQVAGNPRTLVAGSANTATATSGEFTPTAIGRYCFRSLYFGDVTYGASFDARQRECFRAKAISQTSSSVSAPWGPYVWSVPDTAVVTGSASGGTPTGTVVFHICAPIEEPAICDDGQDYGVAATLTAGPGYTAHAAAAGSIVGIPLGRICYRAEYLGNDKYLPSSHATAEDCFVAGYYPRPKGATPLRVPLVPAFERCTTPNRTHGAPLSFGSCSPPVAGSSRIFIGIGDGDPAPAKSIGSVLLKAIVGDPGEPDDADLSIATSITNVMNTSDRTDYTGELQTVLKVRLTDREAFGEQVPQTTQDFPFRVTVGCNATADTTVGATCALATTADSVLPGAIPEGLRSIWGLGAVRVYDGGSDGDADTTGDNSPFAVQGVFVP
jgi:hypothetical protein